MHRSACWTVETPLRPCLSFPTNMSTNPQFKCIQCRKFKSSGEFRTRQSGNSLAKKGDCLSCCLSCSTTSMASRKRRHVESNSDWPAKRLATQPHTSPSQFMEVLAKSASTAEINGSWHVSMDGMTLPDKGVADHLASLVWEATGYRFRWAVSICFAIYSSFGLLYTATSVQICILCFALKSNFECLI